MVVLLYIDFGMMDQLELRKKRLVDAIVHLVNKTIPI